MQSDNMILTHCLGFLFQTSGEPFGKYATSSRFPPSAAFTTTVNLMSNAVFSIDLTDPSSDMATEFRESVMKIMQGAGKPNLGDYFPLLRKNDVLDTLLDIIDENSEEINKFQIQHLLLVNLLDSYTSLPIAVSFALCSIFSHKQCIEQVLFVAGTDTTASTFQWAMAELLRKPQILSRARGELEQIVGKRNPVEEADIARLPYLQAIVKETFRLHPAVPLLLPRKAEADIEIRDFIVPKSAQIFVNAWQSAGIQALGRTQIHSNQSGSWGQKLIKLHLMLGSLINSFEWKLENGTEPEDLNMEDKFGISLELAQPLRAVPLPL
ncbi:hypothetical protein FEM48_Zijuj11G0048400 [Ziziphus jujuba var. spinosa]|uniref:Geraniol 8-hydroxylase-like n=1 Tax=Ziziphus jujuba var. spinosa TaxID=714518 RepID=A0A978UGX9_ZIZJJ|nr:hypothetical protein FEM48_Zijuj11G0048400 [Ziziphus jujuba var. spinosa]